MKQALVIGFYLFLLCVEIIMGSGHGIMTSRAQDIDNITLLTEPSLEEQKENTERLIRLLNKAKKGDRVVVPQGYYDMRDVRIRKDLVLFGEGIVVFQASGPVEKGLLVPLEGVSLQVENITFRGARSRDKNGAGIRHDGKDLKIIACIFEDNENGILATPLSKSSRVDIENATFLNNGHGDGYSHGIYMSKGEQLFITDSRFIGTKIGHHVKSLAAVTAVKNSYFDDAGAGTSYTFDVTRGGIALFTGNFVIQRETAQNATIINYDASRGGKAVSLQIENNQIINRHPEGRFFRNGSDVDVILEGNVINNEGRRARLKIDR